MSIKTTISWQLPIWLRNWLRIRREHWFVHLVTSLIIPSSTVLDVQLAPLPVSFAAGQPKQTIFEEAKPNWFQKYKNSIISRNTQLISDLLADSSFPSLVWSNLYRETFFFFYLNCHILTFVSFFSTKISTFWTKLLISPKVLNGFQFWLQIRVERHLFTLGDILTYLQLFFYIFKIEATSYIAKSQLWRFFPNNQQKMLPKMSDIFVD